MALDDSDAAPDPHTPATLADSLAALRAQRGLARRAATLDPQREAVARRMRDAVLAEVPAYRASGNPDLLPDLDRHVQELLAELGRWLDGGKPDGLAFVRAHARRCAAQRFPLEALLQAYRSLQPIWLQALGNAASGRKAQSAGSTPPALRSFANELTVAMGHAAAADYVAQTRLIAEAEGDRRNELLGLLVSGYDESDARVARLLKRAGYLEQRLSFCVAVAQSTDPLEMENPARAQRIAQALTDAVASLPVRALVAPRGNVVTALFSDTRRVSGWSAPQASLAERIEPRLLTLGPAVLIGLSGDQPSTAYIPRGLHEATVALDFANVGERVMAFSRLPIRRLLIHRGADYVQSALPTWWRRLHDADGKAQGALLVSLRALADADMNMQAAARALGVHPNTLYARLLRVHESTGLNAQRYHDLTHLLLAADCARM